MINFIREQLIIRKLKKDLRAYVKPDKAFLDSAKLKFITLAEERTNKKVLLASGSFNYFRYATAMAVVVLIMTSTAAVFADVSNVPVNNPLYNLKRVSEKVRVALVPQPKQIELHRVFAHRRLEESSELGSKENIPAVASLKSQAKVEVKIEKVENKIEDTQRKVEKVRIDRLNKDFEKEMETGLKKAQEYTGHPQLKTNLCDDILETIRDRRDSSGLSSRIIGRLEEKCQEGDLKGPSDN